MASGRLAQAGTPIAVRQKFQDRRRQCRGVTRRHEKSRLSVGDHLGHALGEGGWAEAAGGGGMGGSVGGEPQGEEGAAAAGAGGLLWSARRRGPSPTRTSRAAGYARTTSGQASTR